MNFNEAYPADVFDDVSRAEILRSLDFPVPPSSKNGYSACSPEWEAERIKFHMDAGLTEEVARETMEKEKIGPLYLPGWNSYKPITYFSPSESSGTEQNRCALQYAYEEIATQNTPSSNKYHIFRMMTGTGKSTIVPVAWLMSGARGKILVTQPRRENVLSVYGTLSTYAGEKINFDSKFIDPKVQIELDEEPPSSDDTRENIVLRIYEKVYNEVYATIDDVPDRRKLLHVLVTLANNSPTNTYLANMVEKFSGTEKYVTVDYRLGKKDEDPDVHEEAADPKILIVSEGWLLEKLISEPSFMKQFHTIMFDEVHERTSEFDIIYSMNNYYPNAHVILASATLDENVFMSKNPERIFVGASSRHLEIVRDILPMSIPRPGKEVDNIFIVLKKILSGKTIIPSKSSIIAFVPTQPNVEKLMKDFKEAYPEIKCFDFTSKSLPSVKDESKTYPHQKVIFATNAGETGITFKGLNVCIDSGTQNYVSYDPIYDAKTNAIVPIFNENSMQRRGRANRTMDGWFIPLYDPNILQKSPPPKILDTESSITLHRLMRLGQIENFRIFNSKLLTPISDIAIYHGLSNLYQTFIINDPLSPGVMFKKRTEGNIRYLVAAGLSKKTYILFMILYTLSVVGINNIYDCCEKMNYTDKPFGSDHLQLIFHFCDNLFLKMLDCEKLTGIMCKAINTLLELVKLDFDDKKYLLECNRYMKVNYYTGMEREKKLAVIRCEIERRVSNQCKNNFADFRRSLFLSHEDKIAEKVSNNDYVWRGLPVKINTRNESASFTTYPTKIETAMFRNLSHKYELKQKLFYFVAAPPRVVFSKITKPGEKNYAVIDTITAV